MLNSETVELVKISSSNENYKDSIARENKTISQFNQLCSLAEYTQQIFTLANSGYEILSLFIEEEKIADKTLVTTAQAIEELNSRIYRDLTDPKIDKLTHYLSFSSDYKILSQLLDRAKNNIQSNHTTADISAGTSVCNYLENLSDLARRGSEKFYFSNHVEIERAFLQKSGLKGKTWMCFFDKICKNSNKDKLNNNNNNNCKITTNTIN